MANEDLEPGARIEAERRLNALERDLEAQMHASRERARASRYHKIKFFERQKIHRKVRQLKRALENAPESKHKKLHRKLKDARVLLNYVLYFPKDARYVALYAGSEDGEPVVPSIDSHSRADRVAAEFARDVRKLMKRGELSSEPEVELGERERLSRQRGTKRARDQHDGPREGHDDAHDEAHEDDYHDDEDHDDDGIESDEDDGENVSSTSAAPEPTRKSNIKDDDFFAI